ncbi:MAG: TonB-dependent receptor [Vicinamibacterales bacterium]|nr:TonB-dependent receptor [Vicinamibacterales bacterium]
MTTSAKRSRIRPRAGRLVLVVAVAACLWAARPAGAEEVPAGAPLFHETVVVTAGRAEQRPFDVPRSVTVVEVADLDDRLPPTIPDALADAPGLFLQKTNPGSGAPYIRGMLGNQILVLIDGVRLNNATFRYGPNQYLATVDPALVERIEVLRGAGSVLYGSDAIGGVVNIVTRRPSHVGQPFGVHGTASTRVVSSGMEQSGRVGLEISGPKGGLLGGVSLRRFGDLRAGGSLGVEAPSGYNEVAGDVRVEIPWSQRRLTLAYQHHRQNDVPRFDQVTERGFSRYVFAPQVRQLALLRYEHASPEPWRARVSATASLHRSTERREYQRRGAVRATVEQDDVLAAEGTVELHSRLHQAVSLVSGLSLHHDHVGSSRREVDRVAGDIPAGRGLYPDGATASALALFTQATVTGARWTLETGLRASRFDVRAPDPMFGSARLTPARVTGSVGGLVPVTEGVRLFGTVSQGFRAPNIDDLSSLGQFDFGVEVPSPGLQPESSLTLEGGVKARSRLGSASASVFRTSLGNLIERVQGSAGGVQFIGDQRIYQKVNTGSAFTRGVELEAEHRLTPSLFASGFVTYVFGHATSTGEPLRRISPLNGRVALRASPSTGYWFEGAVRFAAAQRRLAAGDIADHRIGPDGTPGWWVVNADAGRRLTAQLHITAGVQNLFNRAYRTHGSGVDGVGRSVWVGIRADAQ